MGGGERSFIWRRFPCSRKTEKEVSFVMCLNYVLSSRL